MIEIEKTPREECGLFALYLHPTLASNNIVDQTLDPALKNQNRGEESAGISVSDGFSVWHPLKRMGKIPSLYEDYKELKKVNGGYHGYIAVVHNRYSTTGLPNLENTSPFRAETALGAFTASLNGNITNAAELKASLMKEGVEFASTTDSEVVTALIAQSPGNSWQEKVREALTRLEGAFCLVITTKDAVLAARDRNGIHPLSIAYFEVDGKECFAVSSETAAFSKLLGAVEHVEDVLPGELVEIKDSQMTKSRFITDSEEAFCKLELVYLMRQESRFEGRQLAAIRRHLGRRLARTCPPPPGADLVTCIPESAGPASRGYAEESRFPWEETLTKDRNGTLGVGSRGFMNPTPSGRKKVGENYGALDTVIDKKIVVVDDSIIGGTTARAVVEIYKRFIGELKNRGAKEVHLRIVLSQVIGFCPYGVDIDEKRYLIAKEFAQNVDEIAREIGADSLAFLPLGEFQEGINEVVGRKVGLCQGCTTGVYPQPVSRADKLIFESEIK